MNLTIGFITSRHEPCFAWMFDSLKPQIKADDQIQIVVIDLLLDQRAGLMVRNGQFGSEIALGRYPATVEAHVPKPCVWQGEHRRTRENWWAISNSKNSVVCYAIHPWVAFLDDRCVLLPGYLDSIRDAIAGEYAVAGAYEKR